MARLPDDLPAHKALNCQVNLSQADHEVASGIAVLVVLVTDGKGKGKGRYRSSWEPHLRATGRHLPYGSHSVTCHPTQVNTSRLTPVIQAGSRFTYP